MAPFRQTMTGWRLPPSETASSASLGLWSPTSGLDERHRHAHAGAVGIVGVVGVVGGVVPNAATVPGGAITPRVSRLRSPREGQVKNLQARRNFRYAFAEDNQEKNVQERE